MSLLRKLELALRHAFYRGKPETVAARNAEAERLAAEFARLQRIAASGAKGAVVARAGMTAIRHEQMARGF